MKVVGKVGLFGLGVAMLLAEQLLLHIVTTFNYFAVVSIVGFVITGIV